ncbi:FMN-binding protein [Clostridium sp. MB40-C1]|uniref:FMN-binding protein n=1 Tax=Clostridium sp. MB40-C1 TaxID=3070996 RepID=UPI0027E04A7C|nr:FMN-binding protein [Clostridium sp. MB40-C1]WMJ79317.1 FMN-binding protein [Clostridium sp. MB40-C1]
MKRVIKILGIVFLTLCIVMSIAFFYIKSIKVPEIPVVNVNLKNVSDGSYTGEYFANPVKAVVKVQVKNNKIVNIIIMEHKNGMGKNAEKIIDKIISKQSLDVDSISGSTLSSNVIRKAVEVAINKY